MDLPVGTTCGGRLLSTSTIRNDGAMTTLAHPVRPIFGEHVGHPTVDVETAYAHPRPEVEGRPWGMLCMVSSIDGATTLEGRSGGLGNATDAAILATLRRVADVVVVGAGTARSERYGPPSKPGLRIGLVSGRGQMDYTTPLFESGAGFMILPESAPEVPVDAIRAGHTTVDLGSAMAQLAAAGHRVAQIEGGPTLNGALANAGLIDEINLTLSPLLAGGDAARIIEGAPELATAFELWAAYEADGFLFTRWRRR